jgi:hypothetical protein
MLGKFSVSISNYCFTVQFSEWSLKHLKYNYEVAPPLPLENYKGIELPLLFMAAILIKYLGLSTYVILHVFLVTMSSTGTLLCNVYFTCLLPGHSFVYN